MANNFEERMKHEKLMIDTNQNLCSSLLTVVSSLLQTESLFTRTSEAISADISFLQVFIYLFLINISQQLIENFAKINNFSLFNNMDIIYLFKL